MFEIGSTLRQARQRLGVSVEEAGRATRIRVRYLQALEDERWHLLPGRAYGKAFLREYCDFLGLDAELLVHAFTAAYPPEEEAEIVVRGLPPAQRFRVRPVHVSVAGMIVLAFAAFRVGGDEPTAGPVLATPQAAAAPTPARRESRKTPKRKPKPAHVLVLRATEGASWLDVRRGAAAGAQLFYGTLDRGRTLRLPLKNGIWFRVGAPDNLRATANGRPLRLPGDTANVTVRP